MYFHYTNVFAFQHQFSLSWLLLLFFNESPHIARNTIQYRISDSSPAVAFYYKFCHIPVRVFYHSCYKTHPHPLAVPRMKDRTSLSGTAPVWNRPYSGQFSELHSYMQQIPVRNAILQHFPFPSLIPDIAHKVGRFQGCSYMNDKMKCRLLQEYSIWD